MSASSSPHSDNTQVKFSNLCIIHIFPPNIIIAFECVFLISVVSGTQGRRPQGEGLLGGMIMYFVVFCRSITYIL
jgi:hypothetical protein